MSTPEESPPVLTQHVCFHAWENGLMTQQRERRLQEDVSAQVTAWLNSKAEMVKVLHISTGQTSLGAYATIWFKPAT